MAQFVVGNDAMEYHNLTPEKALRLVALAKHMDFLLQEDVDPTWRVFSATFAWRSMSRDMSIAERLEYEATWRQLYDDLIPKKGHS